MRTKNRLIRNFDDLLYEKRRLQIKVAKSERKIVERFQSIKNESTATSILSEVLNKFDMQSDYITLLLPLLFKFRKSIFNNKLFKNIRLIPRRKWIILSLIATGAGAGIYYWWRKRKNSTVNNLNDEYDEFDDDFMY